MKNIFFYQGDKQEKTSLKDHTREIKIIKKMFSTTSGT